MPHGGFHSVELDLQVWPISLCEQFSLHLFTVEDNPLNLKDYGWSNSFASDFAALSIPHTSPARVALDHRELYVLYTEQGDRTATLSGRFRHQLGRRVDFPVVGDWVAAQVHDDAQATIHAVLPRRSLFSRKMAGATTEVQLLAANVDVACLVSGLDHDFNLRRIERYLVLAWDSGANPVLVLNKADLCPDVDAHLAELEAIAPGVPVLTLSAAQGEGIAPLRELLNPGQTAVLLGSSGVGKSTITNQLLGREIQVTQETRSQDGKGRHTTTHRELLRLPNGALLIDTPGLREIQLWASEDSLHDTFADIDELAQSCRFRDCQHQHEPGCAVQEAIANGLLNEERLMSYQKLQRELAHLERKQDQRASAIEKAKWKAIHKAFRHNPKR